IVDFFRQTQRMNRHGLGVEKGQFLVERLLLGGAEVLEPRLRLPGDETTRGGQLAQHRRGVAGDGDIDAAIVAQLAIVEVDLDDRGVGTKTSAVAKAKVERRAEDENDIGTGERLAPRADE